MQIQTIKVRLSIFILTLAAITMAACHELPKSYDASSFDSSSEIHEVAGDFWKNDKSTMLARGRIAIVEFNVEYVTDKMTSLLGDQQMAVDAREFSMIGGAATLVGVGRDHIEFEDAMKPRLATQMYQQFVEQLQSQGFSVTPLNEITECKVYSDFQFGKPGDKPFMLLNIEGSDTGRVKASQLYPAKGLAIIKSVQSDEANNLNEAMRQIVRQTGADAAVRVKIRVGLFGNRPTLEAGSVVAIAKRDQHTSLKSSKSLVASNTVIDDEKFKLLEGDVLVVNPDEFESGILEIFPTYTAMALDSLGQ